MKSSFSELSYAFALTENLTHLLGMPLLSAPSFPSTYAEGKNGAGHDLKLSYPGFAVFLQFKLSHCMTYASAKEFTSGHFSQKVGGVKEPVYRMYLHALRKSRQTSLMLKLERRFGHVYYVAPLFHLPTELNNYYLARSVASESRFFSPSVIKKMPDQDEHFVSFRRTGKPWRFSDDPTQLLEDAETQDQVVRKLKNAMNSQKSVKSTVSGALDAMEMALHEDIHERMNVTQMEMLDLEGRIDLDRELIEIDRLFQSDMPTLLKAEFIARAYFDSQLLVFSNDD